MADAVALGIKPPAQMTLGDMVNIARGAQAYQQAEQANPLALEKSRIEIQKAGQEARTGQINLGVAEQGDIERKNMQTFMADPKNWQNADGDVDVAKINAEITKIAPLTGREHIANLTTLAKSQTENLKATQDLTQGERAILAGPLGVLGRMKIQNKDAYLQELDNQAKFHPDNKRLHRLIEAQKDLIKQMPAGSDMASAGIRASQNLLNPEQAQTAFSPKARLTDIGGQLVETTETPSVGNVAPRIAKTGEVATKTPAPGFVTAGEVTYQVGPNGVVPLGEGGASSGGSQFSNTGVTPTITPPVVPPAGQRPPVTAPAKAPAPAPVAPAAQTSAPVSTVVPLDMPVNTSGIVQLNTQQRARYNNGLNLIKESNDMAQGAGDSRQTIRQIRENIGEASGSRVGQVLRSAGKWVAGNEQLDELVKGLATNQLQQAKLMGISTDSARATSAQANGSENITVGALNKIVNRADAMNSAVEKYSAGLQKFTNKYGGYNGPIHAEKFQQSWANNYDPLIFMVKNVQESNMSPVQKQAEISLLQQGLSDEQKMNLAKKAKVIGKLERGEF
jgi:hypothetical protein